MFHVLQQNLCQIKGNLQKKNSLFVDIVQIDVDPPPSYPIFDKLFLDAIASLDSVLSVSWWVIIVDCLDRRWIGGG